MVSPTDLSDMIWCPRIPWFKSIGVQTSSSHNTKKGMYFHKTIEDLFNQIRSMLSLHIPGKIIGTEIYLPQNKRSEDTLGLVGRVDVLRQTSDGFIVQELKSCDPPASGWIYETHRVQLNAYAYLAEVDGFSPVVYGIVIYRDLMPREIEPDIDSIPNLVRRYYKLRDSFVMPEGRYENCRYCSYRPLCSILPRKAKITKEQLLSLRELDLTVK